MNQMTLPWDDVVRPRSSNLPKHTPFNVRTVTTSQISAAAMRPPLWKNTSPPNTTAANRMLALPPTRKRLQDAAGIRREAIRLARIQSTLVKLAQMHEEGSMLPELAALVTRASVERALHEQSPKGAIHLIYGSTDLAESGRELALRLEREAMLRKIPGFFPTPPEVATELLQSAALPQPSLVLEPSAGSGSLIDAIRNEHPTASISYCEINCFLLDLLRAKYERSDTVHFIGRDFLDLAAANIEQRFDGIVLNPPFERREDIDHILRAYQLLPLRESLGP